MVTEPSLPDRALWCPLVQAALDEDLGAGDVTTELTIPKARLGQARIEAREAMVVCGLPMATEVFRRVDPSLEVEIEGGVHEGKRLDGPAPLLRVRGRYQSILIAERTALNFMGRLCGIASQTRKLVDLVDDLGTHLVDTRKTTPGWRFLEKYAVAVGGGVNHRVGLYDAVLVKDNHIAAAGSFDAAVRAVVEGAPSDIPVQIEVESEAMADRAIELGARFLLLDNFSPKAIQGIVEKHGPTGSSGESVLLEASGGIGPHNVRAYAETGVARISMGALTHSVMNADVALEVDLLPDSVAGNP